jgi:hypothetical protein
MDPDRVPLREAALRAGVPEEQLRRKILTGELAAAPVDDDRQYLVRLADVGVSVPPPRPCRPKPCRVLRALALGVLLALLVAGCGVSTTSLCENCGASRRTVELVKGVPIARTTRDGHVTPLIRRAYPGPCRHAWVTLWGTGGGFTCRLGKASDRAAAVAVADDLGILDAAAKVDPAGAADLARWVLKGGATTDEVMRWWKELPRFDTPEAFRGWFLARLAKNAPTR